MQVSGLHYVATLDKKSKVNLVLFQFKYILRFVVHGDILSTTNVIQL